jgi:hypothetical protein
MNEEKSIEEKYTQVPDNIKFNTFGQLVFNDGQQTLYADNLYTDKVNYGVSTVPPPALSGETRYLVPCERSDLKTGDIAFRWCEWDELEDVSSRLYHYSCILDEERYAVISIEQDVYVYSHNSIDWLRVMTKKEIQKMEVEQ